ncbi:kinase-like domain-containing protein [Suillus lakei]|nr:kinase-like domain-containing protein [Suillus lakei]
MSRFLHRSDIFDSQQQPHIHLFVTIYYHAFMLRHLKQTPRLKIIFPITFLMRNPLGFRLRKLLDRFRVAQAVASDLTRFKVEAKLGFGTTPSLWLTHDLRQPNKEDKLQELKVLQYLSSDTSPSLPIDTSGSLLDYSFLPSGIEDNGKHSCLVMDLLGSNIQRMLKDVLLGIAHAHRRGVAHTDLLDIKPDNFMIALSDVWTTEAIAQWLKANPPLTHPLEHIVPSSDFWRAAIGKFMLADWGGDDITSPGLRPPEIILGGGWDESVDIWTFGCIVFNALTNCLLFKPIGYEEKIVSEESMLLLAERARPLYAQASLGLHPTNEIGSEITRQFWECVIHDIAAFEGYLEAMVQ